MPRTTNTDWIFHAIENLERIRPSGFLLKKATHGRYLDAFKLKTVKTTYFRKKLILELKKLEKKIEDDEVKISNFYADQTDKNTISVLDVNEHLSIKNTIEQIFQLSSTNPIESLGLMKRAKFSAMLFDVPEDKAVITIDSVSIYSKAFEKGGLVATYDEVGLEELSKDSVLVFSYNLPCIYFEESGKLLVLDKSKTEKIFNLIEHYQEKAKGKFAELVEEGIVKLTESVFQNEMKNITTARRVNNMIESGFFNTDIAFYKKYETFFASHTELDDELTQLVIQDEKVILDTKDRFKSFLHMTSKNIMSPVIDESEFFISFQKRLVKTRT